jgi:creatinine amidohydrolase/Fe(II)-dependent formamide hydrolase-like protein
MTRINSAALLIALSVAGLSTRVSAEDRQSPDAPRPIEGGTTTIIIATGGVEQNGPYVVGGKHNYVSQTVLPYVAREIGHALIAPITTWDF